MLLSYGHKKTAQMSGRGLISLLLEAEIFSIFLGGGARGGKPSLCPAILFTSLFFAPISGSNEVGGARFMLS